MAQDLAVLQHAQMAAAAAAAAAAVVGGNGDTNVMADDAHGMDDETAAWRHQQQHGLPQSDHAVTTPKSSLHRREGGEGGRGGGRGGGGDFLSTPFALPSSAVFDHPSTTYGAVGEVAQLLVLVLVLCC